ncbi:MAG: Gfo/Idh/MocA family oxidoreductase [Anaerolineales bacterium]
MDVVPPLGLFADLRMLLGEVEGVWCFAGRRGLGLPVEDTAEIGLRFASGVVGSMHLNYIQRPPKHNLEIVGTEGTIRWDNAEGAARLFWAGTNVWETVPTPAGFTRNDLFLDEMVNFLGLIRGEVDAVCSLEDGVQALRLALGALESAEREKMEIIAHPPVRKSQ